MSGNNSDDGLVSSMNQKLRDAFGLPTKCCIYRVPDNLRSTETESCYVPRIVSIGPFHNGNENLKAMEQHKWVYLNSLLSRRPSSGSTNNSSSIDITCVQRLKHLEPKARESYSETLNDIITSNDFLQMMILDGCFIIELLIRHKKNSCGEEINDPVFTAPWMLPRLARDMLLLENQIPFIILEHLVIQNQIHLHLNIHNQEPSSLLVDLALDFFRCHFQYCMPPVEQERRLRLIGSNHLLDLLRNCLLPSRNFCVTMNQDHKKDNDDSMQEKRLRIPSAKTLLYAGVRIIKSKADNFFSLNFSNTVLEIPPFSFEDLSDLLPNLVAFEQCHSGCSTTDFTAYACFMLNIITNVDGVRFLRERQIIDHPPDGEEELFLWFKKICSGVYLRGFCFSDVCDKLLNKYYNSQWASWRITLMVNYFQLDQNPWAIITLVNALIVLELALIQTIFTVISYKRL